MAIEGIIGYPGQGKTLLAVAKLKQAHAQGMRCFANFTCALDPPLWERVVWKDIIKLSNAFVVLDEAHMWFPARGYSQTTQAELGIFQQHRKAGLEMVWVAQHEARIDIALRELTTYVHYVKKLGPVNICITCEGVSNRVLRRRLFLGALHYGSYYTEERVLQRDEVTDAPIVGVYPNFARYVDEMGFVRIVKLDELPSKVLPDKLYYKSPWGGAMVEYPTGSVAPVGWSAAGAKENGKAAFTLKVG